MAEDYGETVPGMAELIEARRLACGLTPGAFADAAGVTRTGLEPIRKGLRRAYHGKVLFGVARALNWPNDWLDLILAGDGASLPSGPPTRGDQVEALERRIARLEELLHELLAGAREPR